MEFSVDLIAVGDDTNTVKQPALHSCTREMLLIQYEEYTLR